MSVDLKVVPLPVPDPTTMTSLRRLVTMLVADVESGCIQTMVVLIKRSDGRWDEMASEAYSLPEVLGALEVIKARWIAAHLVAPGACQNG